MSKTLKAIAVFVILLGLAAALAKAQPESGNNTLNKKTDWGEAVEGVQVRLRAEKKVWRCDEIPILSLDLKNSGKKPFDFTPVMQAHCTIELDGRRHGWADELAIDARGRTLLPGEQLKDAIGVRLVESWALYRGRYRRRWEQWVIRLGSFGAGGWGSRLNLFPGKHTLRVGFFLDQNQIPAISNTVEIPVEKALPGSRLSIEEAVREGFPVAVLCEATGKADMASSLRRCQG